MVEVMFSFYISSFIMDFLPDSALVLIACLAVLAVCVLIFVIVLKIAFKIRSMKAKYAAMGASVLYALSPIDLVPDFIPVLGQIDDAGALAAFAGLAYSVYSGYKKKKNKPDSTP